MVSEEHSDKNTTPPLVTAQTTAVDVTFDSDVDAVVNKRRARIEIENDSEGQSNCCAVPFTESSLY